MANPHYSYKNVDNAQLMKMLKEVDVDDVKFLVDAHRHPSHYNDPGLSDVLYIKETGPGQAISDNHHGRRLIRETAWTCNLRIEPQLRMVSDVPSTRPPVSNSPRSRNIAEIIRKYDRNGDGKISVDEIEAVLKDLGVGVVSSEVARLLFQLVDENKNGVLDPPEILAFAEIMDRMYLRAAASTRK